MTRKGQIRGTLGLLELLESSLRAALPADWAIDSTREPSTPAGGQPGARPDMLLRLTAPDGSTVTVLVEAKSHVVPRDVSAVVSRMRRLSDVAGAEHVLLATQFVSPLLKRRLADADVSWFDATGNLRLRTRRPAAFVDRSGAERNPFTDPDDRRLKSLRGRAAARLVHALCEVPLPLGVRLLAERANVATASSSRVLDLLDREGLVERRQFGEVLRVHKRSLVRRWTHDYGLRSSNEVATMLDPRGVEHAVAMLDPNDERCVVTGSAAARAYLPDGTVSVAPFTTLVVHVSQPGDWIRRAGLRRAERGSNILVVQPFDRVILDGGSVVDGLRCAAPAQVVADLLTGPGRSAEEGEQLIGALAADDQGWAR